MRRIFWALPLLMAAHCQATVQIDLYHPETQTELHSPLFLPETARLADLLNEPSIRQSAYWPASRLSNETADLDAQQQQQRVLQQLEQLVSWAWKHHQTELAYHAQLLQRDLADLRVAGRLSAHLNPDLVRIRAELNPPLAGRYRLYLPQRDAQVYIIGLISGPRQVAHLPAKLVTDYLSQRHKPRVADPDMVLLCQPDGRISRVPVAYWNRLRREPMPGATLFVPFDARQLPEAFQSLNHHIAHLLASRIVIS